MVIKVTTFPPDGGRAVVSRHEIVNATTLEHAVSISGPHKGTVVVEDVSNGTSIMVTKAMAAELKPPTIKLARA